MAEETLNQSPEAAEQEQPRSQNGVQKTEPVAEAADPEIALEYTPVPVNIKTLLAAGAHFGHKAERWNPKMLPYIYGVRNKIHIINLDLTLELWKKARQFVHDVASRGGTILFVGTKQQAREVIHEAAERCGAYFVNHRWLGGALSNLETIKGSISRMRKLEELLAKAEEKDSKVRLAKKERLGISRQLQKLEINLGGIRKMGKHPDAVVIVDINKENIAVAEAIKLHIPVVALVDTNVDPRKITFPIPCNDDAARTIRLLINGLADAVLEGRREYQARAAQVDAKFADEKPVVDTIETVRRGGGSADERQGEPAAKKKKKVASEEAPAVGE